MAFISVRQSAHLRATVLAIQSAGKDIRRDIRTQTRAVAGPEWKAAIEKRAGSVQQARMIAKTARVAVGDQSVRVRAAGSRRKALSGGATPVEHGKAWEFGSRTRSRGIPGPRRSGYVFYPALAEMAPRIIALWVQTAIRRVHEALEGRQ